MHTHLGQDSTKIVIFLGVARVTVVFECKKGYNEMKFGFCDATVRNMKNGLMGAHSTNEVMFISNILRMPKVFSTSVFQILASPYESLLSHSLHRCAQSEIHC